MDELGKNLKDLEKIVQGKQGNLNVIEDGTCDTIYRGCERLTGIFAVLRQRMISESTSSSQETKGGGGNG